MDLRTPDTDEVQTILKRYLVSDTNVNASEDIDPDENLLDAGILDSLGIAEITEHMEKVFEIEIEEDEVSASNYRSLNTLTAFCRAKMGERAAVS